MRPARPSQIRPRSWRASQKRCPPHSHPPRLVSLGPRLLSLLLETVRLRALAMGADLRPAAGESLAVTITNPDGVTIAKWARDTDASGAVELTLPTSVEPSLGDYSVQAESAISGTAATATFAIDEYVLPRFEVALDMDAAIVRGDSELHGTVSATYTYGEQVEGEVTVNVYYQQRYYNYLGGFGRGGPEQRRRGVGEGRGRGDHEHVRRREAAQQPSLRVEH